MKIIARNHPPNPYLRAFLSANGYSYEEVRKKIGRSKSYVQRRMQRPDLWTLQDLQYLSDWTGFSLEELRI